MQSRSETTRHRIVHHGIFQRGGAALSRRLLREGIARGQLELHGVDVRARVVENGRDGFLATSRSARQMWLKASVTTSLPLKARCSSRLISHLHDRLSTTILKAVQRLSLADLEVALMGRAPTTRSLTPVSKSARFSAGWLATFPVGVLAALLRLQHGPVEPRPGGAARNRVPTSPDRSWRDLYLAGAVSALISTLAYIVADVVEFTQPSAPTSGGVAVLEHIAAHRTVYIVQQILWLAPSVLLVVVFLALYMALKDVNRVMPRLAAS